MSSYVLQELLIDTSSKQIQNKHKNAQMEDPTVNQQQDKISSKDVKPGHHHTGYLLLKKKLL
jgi:hypothetical protein